MGVARVEVIGGICAREDADSYVRGDGRYSSLRRLARNAALRLMVVVVVDMFEEEGAEVVAVGLRGV